MFNIPKKREKIETDFSICADHEWKKSDYEHRNCLTLSYKKIVISNQTYWSNKLFYNYVPSTPQDIKMKKMAGLQLTVVTDPKSKQAIEKQIAQWDENLEKLFMEQYRLRCYMASLQGSELPNPKVH